MKVRAPIQQSRKNKKKGRRGGKRRIGEEETLEKEKGAKRGTQKGSE